MTEQSFGQRLFYEKGIRQSTSFLISDIPKETALEWSDSFPKVAYRRNPGRLKDTSILLVISQNCDIATMNDSNESCIELVVCKNIKEKKVHAGNQYVKSVRKLHFKVNGNWYEANVEYILTVDKKGLYFAINENPNFDLIELSQEDQKSIPLWRSNRYNRSALPDEFNNFLFPALALHLPSIDQASISDNDNCIRAIYISVSSIPDSKGYKFELFALIKSDTDNERMSNTQTAIEDFCFDLAVASGYEDESEMYADFESNTYISYLINFVRLNLDHHSLAKGDDDVGPKEI